MSEVLPLEEGLTRFLKRRWVHADEIMDLRQEIYIRLYQLALHERPSAVKPLLYTVARNLMIDRLRKQNVVSIETMADIDSIGHSDIDPGPEQRVAARQELRRLQLALNDLPSECREVIVLRRVFGYSQREVAQQLGIKEDTVENLVGKAVRLLASATRDRRGALMSEIKRLMTRKG